MSNIKKGIKALIFVLILFMSMNNIKALGTDMDNDLKYIPNMEVEKLIEDHNIILPTKPTRAASSNVVEKIIKNSNGIMTGKEFRIDGKLVEAVYYNYLGNNTYQLCKRNLYHSDGKTIERTRLYNNNEWITNTKRYTEKGIIDWTTDYDGTSNKYPTVSSKYEVTGKFWIYTNYYNKGILSSKDYRPGLVPNHISHTGFYEVTGTNWTKAQYYYTNANPTDKSKIYKVVLYLGHASPNNFKTYETKYRNDGTRDYYIRYEEKNNNRDYLTYYNTAGKVIKTVSYYKGNSNREWETIYNDKDTKASAKKYSNTSGKLIDDVVFQDNGIVDHRTYYNDEGIKIRTLSHYKNSNSVEWETFYKENGFKEKANRYSNGTNKLIDEIVYQEQNKVDVRTYFSEDSKTLRKIRYFKDGDHLRWDINYENGLKKAVKLYNVSNYEFVKEYIYTSDDFELSESLKNDYHDMVGENMLKNIIDDNVLGDYLSKELNLGVNDLVYVEDFKLINDISINGNHECAEEYCTEEAEIIYSINGIKYLNELNSLTITNEEISEITNDLKYLVKLKKLNLNNNSITKLTGLNELRGELDEINLSDNNIEELSLNNDNLKIGILNLENSQLVKIDHNIFDLKNNNKIDKIKLTTNSNLPIEFDKQDYQQLSDGNLFITNNKPLLNLVNKNNVDIYTEDEYDDLDNMIITNQFKDLIKLNGDAIINEITLGFLDNDKEFQLETIVDDKKRDEILNKYHLNKTFLDINKEHIISKEDFKHEGTYFLTISYRKNGLSLTSNVYVRVFKTSEKQYIDNISNGLPGTDRDRYVTFDENNEVQEISDEEYEDIKNNDESIIHSEDINNDIIDENNKAGLILNSIMKTVLNSANDIVNSSMDNVINKNLDEGIIESDYQVQKDEEYLENFDTFYGVKTMMKYITPAQNKKRDYGKYPAGNPGAILATNANRIGHAAILTGTSFDTIEANVPGVQNLKGKYNKWIGNRRYVNQGPGKYQNGDVFAVKVNGLNRDKNKKVVDWARKQLKKRYNFNYLNADQDNTFYCSQLVYRAFLKTYNINLDTSDNNVWIFDPHYVYNKKSKRYVREFYSLRKVIHPMELIATKKTNLIYLQRWGK